MVSRITSDKDKIFWHFPLKFDNQGFLRNAPNDRVRQKIIESRIAHLEQEIQTLPNPSRLTLGQLSDNLEEIGRIATQDAPPVSIDFVKLSAVLAAIGHKTVW